jgi:3-phosphoshikimate 1-carboxyvinyltransferase
LTPYRVRPADALLAATVEVPGSKSIANRALVCAALADGVSHLRRVAPGDDTAAMMTSLARLGAGIDAVAVGRAGSVRVEGVGGLVAAGPLAVDARLAGTTSRFVTAVAALGRGPYTIDGDPPLRRRPMNALHDALVALGVDIEPGDLWGHLPVTVRGPIGTGGEIAIAGDVSSQYITALMLIGPYLSGGLRVRMTTPLVSAPYVTMTAAVMEAFGASRPRVDVDLVVVDEGRYRGCSYSIEPDASSAGYPLAAAAVAGGTVHVPGVTDRSLQGDARFAQILGEMGCDVRSDAGGTTVSRHGPLRGVDVDMVELSDLVPTLAVVAPFATSRTTIRGVGFIRGKESDRISDLCTELRRAGVGAAETADGMTIDPRPPHPATFSTHHDHRLAMALALIGLVVDGVEIEDPDVVSKSWPEFWTMLEELA